MNIKQVLLLPVFALMSANSEAFDWLLEPDFAVSERYTDNLRMQINPARDNFITTLSPGVLLGYQAENHNVKTTFKWNELIYHGESSLDFSEKVANLTQQFIGERFRTDFSGQYAEQSTINTQLDLTDNAFNLQIQIPRTTKSLSPSFTFNLNETNSVQLAYNYTDVTFGREPGLAVSNSFSDYSNQQYSGTLTHMFSDRFSVNLTGAYALFSTSGENPLANSVNLLGFTQDATTFNYQAGFQYAYDERTRLSLSAGIRDTTTDSSNFLINPAGQTRPLSSDSSSTSGNVFSANLNRKFDWGSIDLNGGQQLSPASTNGQRNTTTFSVNARYNLTDRWISGVNASYLLTEQLSSSGATNTDNSRTFTTLSPNIQWRWTPEMSFRLTYSYRQLEFGSINETALGNDLQLQFSYQPQINRQVK